MKRTSVVGRLMASVFAISIVWAVPAQASVGTVAEFAKACTPTPTAKFAPALDGMVRGFLETGCRGDSIDYLSREPQRPFKATVELATPYRGAVLATAQDTTSTYLLYRAADGVRLGKVSRRGVMSPSTRLATATGGGLEGSIAVAGGGWYAVWTERKSSGGFAMHSAASPQYAVNSRSPILPGGGGITDSSPDIARIGDAKHNFLLAFARHTSSGYALLVAHHATPWASPKQLDLTAENPQPAVTRGAVNTYIAWVHGNGIKLATTASGRYEWQTALHQVALPQPLGGGTVGAPQVAWDCRKLYVAFTTGGENSGKVWVDVWANGRLSRHMVRVAKTAAPKLAGIAPRCGAAQVLWTEAGRLLTVKV